jgi:hypothetical protein
LISKGKFSAGKFFWGIISRIEQRSFAPAERFKANRAQAPADGLTL